MKGILALAAALAVSVAAHADPVATLRAFVRDVKSGRSQFTQTVTSPDGAKKKVSSGSFEFSRPNRFRFVYTKPFEQTIVGDGEKVWIYDADLNQVSARKLGRAVGATPAALLAGGDLERDFDLASLPPHDGLDWAEAKPKAKDGAFESVRVGFNDKGLAALEIIDSFGQKSLLRFEGFAANVPIAPETFRFTVPAGADVIEQ
ncbi:MAG TPA: outer membrane lipoprotein chaperone LolA [Caldimonas sp.]|jgi:outer membrane lipoprotein carrier protein